MTILLLLLLVKVAAVVARGPSPLIWDAKYYWELGQSVAGGDLLLTGHEVAYRTPGYPWMLGVINAISAEPLWMLACVQGILWVATVGITAELARLISGDRRTALLVMVVSTGMVSSVTYTTTVLSETLFTFLVMLHLYTVARFVRQPSPPTGGLVGFTLAMAMLTRPVAMLLWIADVIFLLARFFWRHRSGSQDSSSHDAGNREDVTHSKSWPSPDRRQAIVGCAIAALVTVVCVMPWLLRNQAIFGKLMMTEFVGRNIWIVTFQDGSGAELEFPSTDAGSALRHALGEERWDDLQSDQRWRETWTVSKSLTAAEIDDAQGDRLMKDVAFDAIKQSPSPFAKKTVRRIFNFWRTRATELPESFVEVAASSKLSPEEISQTQYSGQSIWGVRVALIDTALRYRLSNSLLANTFLMLLTGLATMLMLYSPATRASGLWLLLVLAYFTFVTAVLEIPGYRYRMIVEPVALAVIAIAATSYFPARHQKQSQPVPQP
ncbi:glycosyltransferase family 39 protein [Stieleria sp. JC731]|uniref:ArnT family glycosyltransferase n=1 Tax=Pirellulaceae TaxID=2691357 RepID=UPI001E37D87E|nr:glycosyltransferase family 39 protein [Stieleria sp. JC731]MCC9599654.1 glycosyltransferase family 39 protein [Stieleria sp. JC731]